MARISRRKSNQSIYEQELSVISAIPRLRTAAYVRLSREKDGDSSIKTQVAMLHKYITDNSELELTETYIDNGFTGIDFDRPEFSRLMGDVFNGNIQCIVVKDLSRFGRNLIEAGNYIENIFPKLCVRFIALTDDFDSSRPEDRNSLALPIKNMVNAMYACDFSKKQVASFELHSRLGDKKINSVPYGYTVNKAENRFEPSAETSPIVQIIFKWYLCGNGPGEIAHRLNDLKVPSPGSYKTFSGEGLWTANMVLNILKNEAYIGNRVLGKMRSALYKNIKTYCTNRGEQYIHENTHEALVSHEDFNAAQNIVQKGAELTAKRKAGGVSKCTDRFHLKVVCRECNRRMLYFPKYRHGDAMSADYKCYDSGKSGDTSTNCEVRAAGKKYNGSLRTDGTRRDCGKKVHEDFVRIVALDAIRNLFYTLANMKQAVDSLKTGGGFEVIRKKQIELKRRMSESHTKLEGLYTDYTDGILTFDDYLALKEHYLYEKQSFVEQLQHTGSEIRRMEQQIGRFIDWVGKIENIRLDDRNVEQALFDEIIDCIYINDKKEVEIVFKCRDVLEDMSQILKEGK